ncbi:MAG: ribonuclease III [Bacteriovoracaceae bacterium]|nr:ribonuclease III [Bacteriovoracaceae bacterium]
MNASNKTLPSLVADYFSPDLFPTTAKTPRKFLVFFRKHPQVQRLQKNLGYKFKKAQNLVQALSHRSFVHENLDLGLESNERLEFLGDALLDLFIAQTLFEYHPQAEEGILSRLRGALVNQEILAQISNQIHLSDCLMVGKGEFKNKGHELPSLISNTLEALVGAIFLEAGYEKTKKIILKIYDRHLPSWREESFSKSFDAKSRLQEKVLSKFKTLPQYQATEILKEGKTFFKVELLIQGNVVASREDISKKKAEKILAEEALKDFNY